MNLKISLVTALTTAGASGAFAGTIIDTNLPAGDLIVNIDGTADGAHAFSGNNQDFWYQPFNASNSLLEVTFQPGTYSFQLVDPTAAAALSSGLTAQQLAEVYTSWTYNSPYVTDWLAFDSAAATNSSLSQLFAGAITGDGSGYAGWNGGGYNTAQEAYDAAQARGIASQIVTGGGRYSGTSESSFTFTSQETLIFAVPDYDVADNGGGVSVLITPSPEPASIAMLGLGGLALLRRRRR